MIDTVNSAPEHWTKGVFTIGSGPDVILIAGACRVLPYVNYFNYLNQGNRFTIHLMNVVNYSFANDVKQDAEQFVTRFENNTAFLNMLKSVKWYIHEHIANYGMMNNDRTRPKNIYQFGMAPEADISLPNFHNIFVLFQELINFDAALKAMASQNGGILGYNAQRAIEATGESAIQKFIAHCWMSSLPEFAITFRNTWRMKRYFWTGNHVSNVFTMEVFRQMNDKIMQLSIPQSFWERVSKEDMFKIPATPVTQYDVESYGLKWNCPIEPLKV